MNRTQGCNLTSNDFAPEDVKTEKVEMEKKDEQNKVATVMMAQLWFILCFVVCWLFFNTSVVVRCARCVLKVVVTHNTVLSWS